MESEALNMVAVAAGVVAAFLFGALVYHPKVLGAVWANGSGIDLNEGPSPSAFVFQVLALIALATVVGITATVNFLGTALLAILAVACFTAAQGLFQKRSKGAVMTDVFFVIGAGALMIVAQGVF